MAYIQITDEERGIGINSRGISNPISSNLLIPGNNQRQQNSPNQRQQNLPKAKSPDALKHLKTRQLVRKKHLPNLRRSLHQSRILAPYIGHKLTNEPSKGRFIFYLSGQYESKFQEGNNPRIGKNTPAWYDHKKDIVHLSSKATIGAALHELIHVYSDLQFYQQFEKAVYEGLTQIYTNIVLREQNKPKQSAYRKEVKCAENFIRIIGSKEKVAGAYFNRKIGTVTRLLMIKLKVGPTKINSIKKKNLCSRLKKTRVGR